ncbi:hypothetical protein BDF22DRAFT_270687 [Syncephalis plumigaleata]|nr:hypothetical protein BDF22DRAFT_270687 [Syncephalis plumigaleata]
MNLSRIRLLLISSIAVSMTISSWFGITQADIAIEHPEIDIKLTSHRNEAAEVNDNNFLRIYPTYRLIGPPNSVKGNRTSDSPWIGRSRTTFVDKDGCTARIADVRYSIFNRQPYEIQFTDYDKQGRITKQACVTITTKRRLHRTTQRIDIIFDDDKEEQIIIKSNPLTDVINKIIVIRSWADVTILEPTKFTEYRYLEYEEGLKLVTAPL